MSEDRNYTSLNLDRSCIAETTNQFCEANSLQVREISDRPGGPGNRILIGRAGIEDATLDIYFNTDGTSTLTWKLGRNRLLGQQLADMLYETINPAEFQSVNMTLIGIAREDIQTIIDLLENDESRAFNVVSDERASSITWRLQCPEHNDSLVVTHHTSRRLQIQGRPLTCYRKLVYLLTDILDLAGLELVLSRSEQNSSVVVRREVAAEFLKKMLPNSFENLPGFTRDLLVSGQCVKLSCPSLPEYSMLLFPELRSLEGALKAKLGDFGFDSDGNDFGYFFDFDPQSRNYALKASFHGHITNVQLRSVLSEAYMFFQKHRHSLFHMNSAEESSRKITGIQQLLTLSESAYEHIDNLYK
ncbi:type II toxin-antitoxin system RnlA family toxin [Klebsiella quasipneumoniae]|uniref:type II toxin-antitoxin system RnlA family toxin n=1 Tax=Klebsiella quasipneumoniae TaxID=1463165 RepID=UPI00255ABCD5|nr:type II toxin-antitoxin system RnlA family toxin [Klebsiella quasipneumoniae]HCA9874633.1 type II toxin-antitoxin system RnlA family toxin [Klebsiella quasipneumoniae subsp. similipneumoniae]MDL4568979.1 type II toxin-antitoxin system RnlA family toxin [Klebsiella quasipneumoniae]MDL4588636.1 type II toxin-antitoxin system RnlA family toxin [Klebsiella quasipneumoniae]MDL4592349.1 type II toxin-antitoxin system RnlA family toxin [Klebsiella quasipneumoniae]MDL4597441.1 type II toxin-antitox